MDLPNNYPSLLLLYFNIHNFVYKQNTERIWLKISATQMNCTSFIEQWHILASISKLLEANGEI
jgi:hypothetical protein